MIRNQLPRGGQGESIGAFMERRQRETANFGPGARVAAHEAYGNAIRTGRDLRLVQPSDLLLYGASLKNANDAEPAPQPEHAAAPAVAPATPNRSGDGPALANPASPPGASSIGHPGFAESFIPVWGSGREAIADFEEGDYSGAALNAALAISDLFIAGTLAKAITKGGLYAVLGPIVKPGKKDWGNVRSYLGRKGLFEKGQHGHHWFIPNNHWGKHVPNVIKNHPLNIKPMPSPEIHMRVHQKWDGKPQFGPEGRYWHGTPHWSKAVTVSMPGHGALGAEASGRDR